MNVKVRLFASLRKNIPELALGESLEVNLQPGTSITNLFKQLGIPENEVKLSFVNGQYQTVDYVLSDNDEIGIFPPVGGG